MRKSPFGMGTKATLHSHLLSDHAMTLKAARQEAEFRQRTFEQRGMVEEAQRIKAEIAATPAGKQYDEVRWIYAVACVGYVAGHIVANNIFDTGEMRLPYDPVNGFIEDLARQKEQLASAEAHIHAHVVGPLLAARSNTKHSALHPM